MRFSRQQAGQKHLRKPARKSRHALHTSLERFFSQALDLLCVADMGGRFRQVNRQWEKVLGHSRCELEGQPFMNFVHPDDRAATLAALARLKGQHKILNFVNRYRAKDGGYRWLEWRAVPSGHLIYAVARDITRQKEAELALQASERRFRDLAELLPQAVFETDLEGRLTFVNRTALIMFGYSAEELSRGLTVFDVLAPGERERAATNLRRRLAGQMSREQDYTALRRDRSTFPAVIYSSPIEEEGRPRGLRGFVVDITERKRAEEALRQSEERFRAFLHHTPASVFLKDAAGRYVLGNAAWAAQFGRPAEELLGQTDLDLWPPDTARAFQGSDQRTRELDRAVEVIERGSPGPDRECWWHVLKFPIHHANGEVWVGGIAMDITARKRAEEALQESESRFHNLFDTMTEGVALHALVRDATGQVADYRILDVNPAFTQQTGIPAAEARGRLGSAIYRLYPPRALQHFAQVATDGRPVRFEDDFPAFGRHFRVSVVCPNPGEFATVFEDITERKRQEEELRRKNEELQRFTYTVSHDLKSPLITIQGFAAAVLKDYAAGRHEHVAQDLQRIGDAAGKMGALLNDLLDLSRVGRQMHPPADVPFEPLVREALDLLAGPIAARRARIVVHPGLPVVRGDRRRLLEVMQNLVENALKFMGNQAEPLIEIGMRGAEPEHVFIVRDNGVGVEPRYRETVFGLFNKLDPASEGTGIGLALVRRIIEVHGGRTWLESEGPGRGATLCFTLPLAGAETPTEA